MYIAKAEGSTPCQDPGNDPETWFAKESSARVREAIRLCGLCPEREACLRSTLRYERRTGESQPAVFGGFTASQRAALLNPVAARATA